RTKNTVELAGPSSSKPNRRNRYGKRSAARPAPAVIAPEATKIHSMDDANIDPPAWKIAVEALFRIANAFAPKKSWRRTPWSERNFDPFHAFRQLPLVVVGPPSVFGRFNRTPGKAIPPGGARSKPENCSFGCGECGRQLGTMPNLRLV